MASLPDEALHLPDEPLPDPTQIRGSTGGRDGVTTRHMGPSEGESGLLTRARRRLGRRGEPPAEIYSRLVALAQNNGDRERLAVYGAAHDPDILQHIDAVRAGWAGAEPPSDAGTRQPPRSVRWRHA